MKIYFCTTAPSKNYKSWSNIPYLLQKNLERKGYVVKNYVMREVEPFKTLFNIPIRVLNKYFNFGTNYFYVRTPVHFFFTYLYSLWIGIVSSKQDLMFVQGFSYPINNGKNRQIILGDWPSEYLFEKFIQRPPSSLELNSIKRENEIIENADAVITLYPNVREYMLGKYKNQNIYCFGNVINIDNEIIVPTDIQLRKMNSCRLLFIGQPFYLSGAHELIAAAKNIRYQGYECEVDIIGIDANLVGVKYEWIKVHGYLDKEKPEDKKKFYNLLSNARLFVNTNPGWSGFQAILEAMYFYTPIAVRQNECLNSYFPDIKNLAYILEDEHENLESILIDCFTNKDKFKFKSDNSRLSVQNSSWELFIEKIILLMTDKI
jgi:glycosyltransferase involved in cell wall biosynthesis